MKIDDQGKTIPLNDWLDWDTPDRTVVVENRVPALVKQFLSNDEASLFSVISYCDILSAVLGETVYLIQSPMKWQPNEIDGFYAAQNQRGITIYPVEAKAVSTNDDINLVQMYGQYKTLVSKYTRNNNTLRIHPVAAKMLSDGMILAVLEQNALYHATDNPNAQMFNILEVVKVTLDTPIDAWR